MTEFSEVVQRMHTCKLQFMEVFGRNLFQYMHPLTGFDIVKLDDDLGVPAGTSMKDFVKENYGPEAVALVEVLIGQR